MPTATRTKNASLVGTIESLLQSVKVSEAHTEPGGYTGPTTHPVKDVDDQTEKAREGARSSENTADVKETIPGQAVDETGSLPSQESAQMSVGMTSEPTGVKVPDTKGGKEDSKTTHPARTDNGSLEGGKYASHAEELRALSKQAEAIGMELCAAISVAGGPKAAESMPVPAPAAGVGGGAAAPLAAAPLAAAPLAAAAPAVPGKTAAQQGYDLAGVFADLDVDTTDKQAADAMVVDTMVEIIETAHRRAAKTAEFYDSYFKSAAGELPPEAMGGGGGGPPPPEAGGGGGGGDDQALLQMLAGQGGGGGGAPPPGAGGMPPEAGGMPPEAGGMPPGAGGEMPPEAGGAPPGAGGNVDAQEMAMLEQILQELQANPEQVQTAAKAALAKQASAVSSARFAGNDPKYAKMKNVIKELIQR